MIFKVDWVETKGADWKVATLVEGVEGGKTFQNVSINRKRYGSEEIQWPNFDAIAPGTTLNGDCVESKTKPGSWSLYPLRPKPAAGPASFAGKGPGIKAAQERKGEMIKEAQGNKELGIKVSSAMRASLDYAVAAVADSRFETQEEREEAMRHAFLRFKAWYLAQWAETEKTLDVPFT
jgi:hypothetical protein